MSDTATPEVPAEEPAVEVVEVVEVTTSQETPAEETEVTEEAPTEPVTTELQVDGPVGTQNDPKGGSEVKGPDGDQNAPEGSAPVASVAPAKDDKPVRAEIPAPAELSRNWNAVTTELSRVQSELSSVRSELSRVTEELSTARGQISAKDAALVELNMLHRSVLSVMGLGASIDIPEISESSAPSSVIEKYESMPAGPERLSFFQANRREIERSLAAKLN